MMRRRKGFTLLEVVVVAAITSVIFLLGFKWIFSLTTASTSMLAGKQASQMTYALDRLEADLKGMQSCDPYSLDSALADFTATRLQFTVSNDDGTFSEIFWRLKNGELQRVALSSSSCTFGAPTESSWSVLASDVSGNPQLFTMISGGAELSDFDAGICAADDSCPVDAVEVKIKSTSDPASTLRTLPMAHPPVGAYQGTINNLVPIASFTTSVTDLAVHFDASASSDPDGQVLAWAWDFGDGNAASGEVVDYSYAATGSYNVTLTVTDDKGGVSTYTATVSILAPPNVAPVASFTSSTNDLSATFDASASSDQDGTVDAWIWDFGDGTVQGEGQNVVHTYLSAGTYEVTLTVTDNDGATSSTTTSVTVTAPVG